MAAGLLFTMVFFVCFALDFHPAHPAVKLNADVHLPPSLAQIIMFSDLECDYINPIDLCNKLNQVRVQTGFFSFSADTTSVAFPVYPDDFSLCYLRTLPTHSCHCSSSSLANGRHSS